MVGEIIPMSVATGPDQMKITSTFAGLARVIKLITIYFKLYFIIIHFSF